MSTAIRHSTGSADDAEPDLLPTGRTRIARIVIASLAVGLGAAVLLPFVPAGTVDENFATGMVLLGFAVGWALLAGFSARSTEPQLWAFGLAVFMGVAGVVVLVAPGGLLDALGWIWPPALLALVVWSYRRARQHLHSRTRSLLINPVLAVLVVVSLAGGLETVNRSLADEPTMSGQLVDVGPYRLHLQCTGTGAPTVVLEPGGGASAATLGWIAPAVARNTRVCVYDRAGRGWSDAARTPPDGAQIAKDLHTLLQRAHVPGPYVLAGHSFGGLYVRSFAATYPDDVAGLVLVDSTGSRSVPVSPQKPGSYSVVKHLTALVSTTARLGLGRLIARASFSDLPPTSRDESRWSAATAMEMASFLDEFAVANRSESEAGQLTDFGGKPLLVLTAERGNAKDWIADQEALRNLSTNSAHHVVPGSTHQSLVDNPRHAAAVVGAIADVVASVRTGAPLSDS